MPDGRRTPFPHSPHPPKQASHAHSGRRHIRRTPPLHAHLPLHPRHQALLVQQDPGSLPLPLRPLLRLLTRFLGSSGSCVDGGGSSSGNGADGRAEGGVEGGGERVVGAAGGDGGEDGGALGGGGVDGGGGGAVAEERELLLGGGDGLARAAAGFEVGGGGGPLGGLVLVGVWRRVELG